VKLDFNQLKFAIVRGKAHNNIAKDMVHVYEMNSTKNRFEMLRNGTVDVALTNTLHGN
jgi:hypothetical protein